MSSVAAPSRASLLGVAPEIRLSIYRYLFSEINIEVEPFLQYARCHECGEEHADIRFRKPSYWDPRGLTRQKCQLLKTNRLINAEATPVFQDVINNLIILVNPYSHYQGSNCQRSSDLDESLVPLKHIKSIELPLISQRRIDLLMFPSLERINLVERRGWLETDYVLTHDIEAGYLVTEPDITEELEEAMVEMEYGQKLVATELLPEDIFDKLDNLYTIDFTVEITIPGLDTDSASRLNGSLSLTPGLMARIESGQVTERTFAQMLPWWLVERFSNAPPAPNEDSEEQYLPHERCALIY